MADTRRKILDAATEQFAANGYEATTVREIADEAGVTSALIHHHFDTKATLLRVIFERLCRLVAERRHLSMKIVEKAPLEDRVQAYITGTFDIAQAHPDFIHLIVMATNCGDARELDGLAEMVWQSMVMDARPLVQEYVEAYPDPGAMYVNQAVFGILSLCVGRTLFGSWLPAPPDGMEPTVWEFRWRDRMTAMSMNLLFPNNENR